MPEHLQKAKERSMAAEKAKDTAPPVQMLGLRKTPKGYEVVSARIPVGELTVSGAAEPLEFASHTLLRLIRAMVAGV